MLSKKKKKLHLQSDPDTFVLSITIEAIMYTNSLATNSLKWLFIADHVIAKSFSIIADVRIKHYEKLSHAFLTNTISKYTDLTQRNMQQLITEWKFIFTEYVCSAYLTKNAMSWPMEHFAAATFLFYTQHTWISMILFEIILQTKQRQCGTPGLYVYAAIAYYKLRRIKKSIRYFKKALNNHIIFNARVNVDCSREIAGIRTMIKIQQNPLANSINDGRIVHLCLWCGKLKAHYVCIKCRSAFYCNKSCQKKDWNSHHRERCRYQSEKTYQTIANTYTKRYVSTKGDDITFSI